MIFDETNSDGIVAKLDETGVGSPEKKPIEPSAPEGSEIPILPFQATSSRCPATPIYQQRLDFTTPPPVQPSKT